MGSNDIEGKGITQPEADPGPVTTHAYVPRNPEQRWGLCGHVNQETGKPCSLGQAAHIESEHPYYTDSPRAQPQDPDAVH